MKIKDFDKIAAYEKAIQKKYGYDAVKNPNAGWDDEKEKEYIETTKRFQQKVSKYNEDNDLVEVDGFLMPKRLLITENKRTCSTCSVYSFDKGDDFYMHKYDCCQRCFVQYVEGREERWESGWRPNQEEK